MVSTQGSMLSQDVGGSCSPVTNGVSSDMHFGASGESSLINISSFLLVFVNNHTIVDARFKDTFFMM